MQDYDTVLKVLLRGPAGCLLQQLTQAPICRWLDVELPRAQQLRVDLLGETESGALEHIELQSRNDPSMPMRMLEYGVGIYRQLGRFPRQTVLYVGKEKLTMPSALQIEHLSFQYRMVDASELDGEAMLASENIADNVLAMLAHVRNEDKALQSVVGRISRLDRIVRQDTVNQLLILSGLREFGEKLKESLRNMPITENIFDHVLLRPTYLKGKEDGRLEGERNFLRKQIEKRFGPLSASATARLDQSSTEVIEEIGLRLLDASSLEELFP